MSELLFVTWDGGGNVPPLRALATELGSRGHRVRVMGHASQAADLAEFDFLPFRADADFTSSAPYRAMTMVHVLSSRAYGRAVLAEVARRPADVIVVDCLLFGVMKVLGDAGHPYVVLGHTLDSYLRRAARGSFGVALRLRGLRPLPLVDASAMTLVPTLAELDPGHGDVVHTGPMVRGVPATAERPTVLVSLSTFNFPRLIERWQQALDAVDGLAVDGVAARVIATLGPSVDRSRLRVPANVEVHDWLPHDEILPQVSVVVGHGGHATTMVALAHGLPLVVLPVDPRSDQPMIGAAVERAGVGRTLGRRAPAAAVRAAIEELLADGPHRAAAAHLGSRIRDLDGTCRAAGLVEAHAG